MNTIHYVKKVHKTYDELPINALDVLFYTWMSYFDMSSIESQLPLRLSSLIDTAFERNLEALHESFLPSTSAKLLRKACRSPRYCNSQIVACTEAHDSQAGIQFGAVAFYTGEHLIVVYEGTDLSSAGWREDFIMAYNDCLGSYPLAADFLRKAMEMYPDIPIYIGGHSKGGNVAGYTLATIEDDSRIQRVYSYEGPGFHSAGIFSNHPERKEKLIRYIPQGAIVGVMLNTVDAEATIVKSPSLGVFQHDALRWKIDKKTNDFVRVKKLSLSSQYLDESANTWIYELTDEEKERFVALVFDNIGDKRGNLYEVLASLFAAGPFAMNMLRSMSKEDRRFFFSVLKRLPLTSMRLMLNRFKRRFKKVKADNKQIKNND